MLGQFLSLSLMSSEIFMICYVLIIVNLFYFLFPFAFNQNGIIKKTIMYTMIQLEGMG